MNPYARLADLKSDGRMTSTVNDDVLVQLAEDVSRAIDNETHRRFYSEIDTRYFDGGGFASVWVDDVVSITTLKVDADGDGVYELTLAVNTDYWLWPDNKTPGRRIDLNPQSAQVTAFPAGRKRIEIVGTFGYSNETELVGTTVNDNPLTAGATTINVAAGGGLLVSVGETLALGSEQVHVSGIATDALAVVRGINGTTAAEHAQGTAVYRRRYERTIERACKMQVQRFLMDQQTGHAGAYGADDLGGGAFRALYPAIQDMIEPYKLLVVA